VNNVLYPVAALLVCLSFNLITEEIMSTLFIKIKHDVNGNPRHVTSWIGYGFKSYAQALECAKTIGGKKFNNKQFGGGIVFQSYDGELKSIIDRLTVLAKGVTA
jgi:hypothetical protein